MLLDTVSLDSREGGEHRLESLYGLCCSVPDLGERFEMIRHLSLMPARQDRLHIGEVLVEGGPPDPGPFRDLRHRHRPQAVLGDQRRGRVECGVTYSPAMPLDRLFP